MIFVTVGTHEQPFNRLVGEIDKLAREGRLGEDAFIQRGLGAIIPEYCQSKEMLSFQELTQKVSEARIVITHGGPGSIMMPLMLGKPPIVVPRQRSFGEHVDNHQVDFTRRLEIGNKVIPIYDISLIADAINEYDMLCSKLKLESKDEKTLKQLTSHLDELTVSIARRNIPRSQ